MDKIFSTAVTLFLIMDPLGNVPIFLAILAKIPPERRKIVLARELLIAFAIMLIFLLIGQVFLDFIGLKRESISVGGGIVLFLISLKMIFPDQGAPYAGSGGEDDEPFLVPLAIPLLAGPSILAVLLLFQAQESGHQWDLFAALTIAWLLTAIILWFSNILLKLLKKRGLIAVERLMGMLLVTLAVQMIMDGVKSFLIAP